MKNVWTSLAILGAAALVVASAPAPAHARPQYSAEFNKTYDIEKAKEVKCGVCHGDGGKDKKVVSDYAAALKDALELKKDGNKVVPEKDAAKIKAALKKVEDKEDPSGKKFGEYLKAGQLPPAAK